MVPGAVRARFALRHLCPCRCTREEAWWAGRPGVEEAHTTSRPQVYVRSILRSPRPALLSAHADGCDAGRSRPSTAAAPGGRRANVPRSSLPHPRGHPPMTSSAHAHLPDSDSDNDSGPDLDREGGAGAVPGAAPPPSTSDAPTANCSPRACWAVRSSGTTSSSTARRRRSSSRTSSFRTPPHSPAPCCPSAPSGPGSWPVRSAGSSPVTSETSTAASPPSWSVSSAWRSPRS